MSTTRRLLALVLCFGVAVAGCASYTARPLPQGRLDTMPTFHVEGPVALGIDPYLDVERQKAVFDEKLAEEGVLAIHVTAQNRAAGPVVIRRGDMVLELPDGQRLVPVDASAAAAKFSGGPMSDIGPALAFGLVGIFAAMHARQKANSERLADYQAKEFADVTLGKDQSGEGFVYFIAENKKTPFVDSALLVQLLDAADGKTHAFRLPLRGGATSQVARQAQPSVGGVTSPAPPGASTISGELKWPPASASYVMSERKSGSYGTGRSQTTFRYLGEQQWQGRKAFAFSNDSVITYVDSRRRILGRIKNDADGTPIESFHPYFVAAEWPLAVGKWWVNRYDYYDHRVGRRFENVEYPGKVEAYETVRTPAGSFKAFRIALGGASSDTVLWYSGDLGLIIKQRTERRSNHYLGAGVHEAELVSYDFRP